MVAAYEGSISQGLLQKTPAWRAGVGAKEMVGLGVAATGEAVGAIGEAVGSIVIAIEASTVSSLFMLPWNAQMYSKPAS